MQASTRAPKEMMDWLWKDIEGMLRQDESEDVA
jgi:hypothetical protein